MRASEDPEATRVYQRGGPARVNQGRPGTRRRARAGRRQYRRFDPFAKPGAFLVLLAGVFAIAFLAGIFLGLTGR